MIENMAFGPELRDGEEVLAETEVKRPDKPFGKAILVVTNERFLVGPEQGVTGINKEDSLLQIPLENIQYLKDKEGMMDTTLFIETDDSSHFIQALSNNKREKVVQSIVQGAELKLKKDETSEEKSETQNKIEAGIQAVVSSAGVLGGVGAIFVGMFLILLGLMFTITIAGAIIGIPMMIFGFLLGMAGMGIGDLGGTGLKGLVSETNREWIAEGDNGTNTPSGNT